MIQRVFGWLGVTGGAAFGATMAVWAQAPYPISILERNVLTPELKPGDKLRVELVVDRRERCRQEVRHILQENDGDRQRLAEVYPSDFGRMGRDVFVQEIPTDPNAVYGPAEVITTAEAECNPWQRWVAPVRSGDPWRDKFTFAPETKEIPGKYAGEYVR